MKATAEWQRKYPEKVASRNKRWKDAHAGQVASASAAYTKRWREAKKQSDPNFLKRRERRFTLKRVGMTEEMYAAKLEAQSGKCAICERERREDEWPFAVDHDHNCCPPNKACEKCHRGILCPGCNTALHKLETMEGWADKAVAYLNRFKQGEG